MDINFQKETFLFQEDYFRGSGSGLDGILQIQADDGTNVVFDSPIVYLYNSLWLFSSVLSRAPQPAVPLTRWRRSQLQQPCLSCPSCGGAARASCRSPSPNLPSSKYLHPLISVGSGMLALTMRRACSRACLPPGKCGYKPPTSGESLRAGQPGNEAVVGTPVTGCVLSPTPPNTHPSGNYKDMVVTLTDTQNCWVWLGQGVLGVLL